MWYEILGRSGAVLISEEMKSVLKFAYFPAKQRIGGSSLAECDDEASKTSMLAVREVCCIFVVFVFLLYFCLLYFPPFCCSFFLYIYISLLYMCLVFFPFCCSCLLVNISFCCIFVCCIFRSCGNRERRAFLGLIYVNVFLFP